MTPEQMQQRFDERAAAQAKALGITPAQRPAWDAFVNARKDMYKGMPMANGDRQARHQAMQSMTADQRAQFMADQMKARSEQMQKVANATKNLRDSLTAEQRAKFDKLGPQQRGWGPKGGPRGDGQMRGMGPRGDGNWQGRGMGPRGAMQQAPAQNNPFAPKQ